jgi:hypothetical protein
LARTVAVGDVAVFVVATISVVLVIEATRVRNEKRRDAQKEGPNSGRPFLQLEEKLTATKRRRTRRLIALWGTPVLGIVMTGTHT